MPNTQSSGNAKEYNANRDVKYEESQRFNQGDAWNAYVVGVANIQLAHVAFCYANMMEPGRSQFPLTINDV